MRLTQQSGAYATQAAGIPATQDAQQRAYIVSITETALPPQLTTIAITQNAAYLIATIESDNATRQSAANALIYSQTVASATQYASDVQVQIADNNRAMAESQYRANAMQWVWYGGAGVGVVAFAVLLVIILWQVQNFSVSIRQVNEQRAWDKVEEDHAKKLFEYGYLPSSAGLVLLNPPELAPQLASQHIEKYQSANNWRAVCKTYVASCIELERGGVRQPFSRPKCLTYELIQDPTTLRVWQLGHDRVIGLLREIGVVDNTGRGGSTRLIVDVAEFARVIDLAHLPKLPPDPIPHAKIMVAGWQESQELAG